MRAYVCVFESFYVSFSVVEAFDFLIDSFRKV